MIPFGIQSPCLWWQAGRGYLHHAGLTLEIDRTPPVASLANASMIDWVPRLGYARCIVDAQRRDLTQDEQDALLRIVTAVSTAAADAWDGATTLAVVIARD